MDLDKLERWAFNNGPNEVQYSKVHLMLYSFMQLVTAQLSDLSRTLCKAFSVLKGVNSSSQSTVICKLSKPSVLVPK